MMEWDYVESISDCKYTVEDIEEVVDKIRYAGSYSMERVYIEQLIKMFYADSGKLK